MSVKKEKSPASPPAASPPLPASGPTDTNPANDPAAAPFRQRQAKIANAIFLAL